MRRHKSALASLFGSSGSDHRRQLCKSALYFQQNSHTCAHSPQKRRQANFSHKPAQPRSFVCSAAARLLRWMRGACVCVCAAYASYLGGFLVALAKEQQRRRAAYAQERTNRATGSSRARQKRLEDERACPLSVSHLMMIRPRVIPSGAAHLPSTMDAVDTSSTSTKRNTYPASQPAHSPGWRSRPAWFH